MRRCTRCHLAKPDANFKKAANVSTGSRWHEWCRQCRETNLDRLAVLSEAKHKIPEEAKPSVEDLGYISLARKELQAFRKRGSPSIPRPYTSPCRKVMAQG